MRINFFEAMKQTACIFSKGEETGVKYYGARYLDPKYSRWLSGDLALGEYIPAAGADTSKLAGMGGVYNTVNLHLYHYSGNNPVKYMDPDGRDIELQNDNLSPKEFKKVEIEFNKVKGSDTEAGKMLREISGDKTKKLTIKFGNANKTVVIIRKVSILYIENYLIWAKKIILKQDYSMISIQL